MHAEDNTQGAPRITAELIAQLGDSAAAGERVNHKRVARVMPFEGSSELRWEEQSAGDQEHA